MTERVVHVLYGAPVSADAARGKPIDGGLPERAGFYAWWILPGSLPSVPSHPHPNQEVGLDLLYVGIAPNSMTSQGTLRSRVRGQHLGGNTGSSTFRLSLAALLLDQEGYEPTSTRTKCVLTTRTIGGSARGNGRTFR